MGRQATTDHLSDDDNRVQDNDSDDRMPNEGSQKMKPGTGELNR